MKKINFLLWILLTWFAYPFLNKKSSGISNELGNKKRILVIPQLSRIGDIVVSTPVFYNIKKTYPDSYLAVVVSKKALGIIKNNPRINKIILTEDHPGLNLIKKLREEKFNYSISLNATSTSTLWSLWSCIPNRIKTVVENPPITEILTDWMANHRLVYKNHKYLPDHHEALLGFLGIQNTENKREVFFSTLGENKASIYVKSLNLPTSTKIVGISITAGNKIKELGDEKFSELAKKLVEHGNTVIIAIGGKNDTERLENFTNKLNENPNEKVSLPKCFYTTDFTLEEIPSLIKLFDLYIAVDTGPIYIAHAVGTPLINIIGPVDPNEQQPNDWKSIRLMPRNHIPPSSFVFKRRGSSLQIKKALENTYVEDIYDAALKLLR